MNDALFLTDKLACDHSLSLEEYALLISLRDAKSQQYIAEKAASVRKTIYKNSVFIRGLIEISNYCKNDCLYCGIRRSNSSCERYRLSEEEILSCCDEGYLLGFRTFVMQGGEDPYFTDAILCGIISKIKNKYPDCAITLSLGERSFESYKRLYDAGASRYLLRHETADECHYAQLHPKEMSFDRRMKCLKDLKQIGYQTGCGFMVSSPHQTNAMLAKDLKFIEEFKPDMCGIGPFIPHRATPFSNMPSGTAELTCYLLSIIRLIHPPILLPATTALGTLDEFGREKGIKAGANVVMPNLSPSCVRAKYELYNNKLYSRSESAQEIEELKKRIRNIGYEVVTDRGDIRLNK
ncbi:MAG: [Clostridia bacterium]|nr:[FeFe] hydrogenase H-cluster radical SAM maturase HydE [Clostridia bacterium]